MNTETELTTAYLCIGHYVLQRLLREMVESGSRVLSFHFAFVQCTLSKYSHQSGKNNRTMCHFLKAAILRPLDFTNQFFK